MILTNETLLTLQDLSKLIDIEASFIQELRKLDVSDVDACIHLKELIEELYGAVNL